MCVRTNSVQRLRTLKINQHNQIRLVYVVHARSMYVCTYV